MTTDEDNDSEFWIKVCEGLDAAKAERQKECHVCFGKGYNEEWKECGFGWGDWFRILCDECEATGRVEIE